MIKPEDFDPFPETQIFLNQLEDVMSYSSKDDQWHFHLENLTHDKFKLLFFFPGIIIKKCTALIENPNIQTVDIIDNIYSSLKSDSTEHEKPTFDPVYQILSKFHLFLTSGPLHLKTTKISRLISLLFSYIIVCCYIWRLKEHEDADIGIGNDEITEIIQTLLCEDEDENFNLTYIFHLTYSYIFLFDCLYQKVDIDPDIKSAWNGLNQKTYAVKSLNPESPSYSFTTLKDLDFALIQKAANPLFTEPSKYYGFAKKITKIDGCDYSLWALFYGDRQLEAGSDIQNFEISDDTDDQLDLNFKGFAFSQTQPTRYSSFLSDTALFDFMLILMKKINIIAATCIADWRQFLQNPNKILSSDITGFTDWMKNLLQYYRTSEELFHNAEFHGLLGKLYFGADPEQFKVMEDLRKEITKIQKSHISLELRQILLEAAEDMKHLFARVQRIHELERKKAALRYFQEKKLEGMFKHIELSDLDGVRFIRSQNALRDARRDVLQKIAKRHGIRIAKYRIAKEIGVE